MMENLNSDIIDNFMIGYHFLKFKLKLGFIHICSISVEKVVLFLPYMQESEHCNVCALET